MADYQFTATDIIRRTSDGAFIPPDPANRDYAEYLQWLDAGGVPDPYKQPQPPIDPELDSVTTGQTTAQILGAE
jgi:hypothetical protein